MFHRVVIGCVTALVSFTVSAANAQVKVGDVSPGKYGWLTSLQDGKTQAAKTGKPMMVVIRCVP